MDTELYPAVLDKGYNKKAFKWFKNKFKDVELRLVNPDGLVRMEGRYDYGDNDSKKDATKAVAGILRYARGFIHNPSVARDDVAEDHAKDLKKRKLEGPLSAADFERLTEDGSLADFREDKEDHQVWSFGNSDLDLCFDIENHADRLVVYITRSITDLDDSGKEALLAKLADSKPFKTATSTEAVYYDDAREWLSIRMTFLYDGSIKGEKLGEAYWDLWNDYSKKVAKALK